MKKTQILGLALFAVFAFSAVAAASAFAESEWLVGAAVVATPLASTTEGELELEDNKAPGGAVSVLCDGRFLGTIGAGKADLIEKAEPLTTESATNEVTCTFVKKGLCEGTETVVKAINLPWETEILLSGTSFLDLILNAAKNPGYEVDCKTILGLITDSCTGNTSSLLTNATGGVLGTFSATISEPGNCSLSKEASGIITGSGLITSTGGAVTVS